MLSYWIDDLTWIWEQTGRRRLCALTDRPEQQSASSLALSKWKEIHLAVPSAHNSSKALCCYLKNWKQKLVGEFQATKDVMVWHMDCHPPPVWGNHLTNREAQPFSGMNKQKVWLYFKYSRVLIIKLYPIVNHGFRLKKMNIRLWLTFILKLNPNHLSCLVC